MLRRLIKTGSALALDHSGANKLISRWMGLQDTPVVLGYHRVVERMPVRNGDSIPAMLISATMLEQHLDCIGKRYHFVSLDELGERLESGRPFKHPVTAVTFDDGYRDFYELAFPLLKRKGIPGAVFVVTDLVGTEGPYDHDRLYRLLRRAPRTPAAQERLTGLFTEHGIRNPQSEEQDFQNVFAVTAWVLKSLSQASLHRLMDALQREFGPPQELPEKPSPLTWDMLCTMQKAGVTVGSHTKSHPLLTNESWPKQFEETCGARQALEKALGTPVKHFAFPGGYFDSMSVRAVADAGYCFAYTTCAHRDHSYPLLTIPRKLLWEQSCVGVDGRFSAALMACQMNRTFDFLSRCRMSHGARLEGRCPVPQTV